MEYSKQTVEEMFNGSGELFPHQKDFLKAVKLCVEFKPEGFTHQHLHELMCDFCGRPETSRYNSFLTVLVNNNLLKKDENKVYTPSALMKCLC